GPPKWLPPSPPEPIRATGGNVWRPAQPPISPPARPMKQPAIAFLLFASLGLVGCGLFGDKKQPLAGERISVLSLDRQLEPDPDLIKTPITLPPPMVNAEW